MLLGAEGPPTERQIDFNQTLTDRLVGDPGSTLFRVCTSSAENLKLVKENAERLAGGRKPSEVRNIRSRFCFGNPLILDFIIGANEALIAIPDRRGHPHLRACLVVDDPDFVTAMQDWYDEFIWEPSSDWVEVRYDEMDEALEAHRVPAAEPRTPRAPLHHQVDELRRPGDDLPRLPPGQWAWIAPTPAPAAPSPRRRCRRRPRCGRGPCR